MHGDYLRVAVSTQSNRDHFLLRLFVTNPANFLPPRLILALQTSFPWCRAICQEVPRCRSATSGFGRFSLIPIRTFVRHVDLRPDGELVSSQGYPEARFSNLGLAVNSSSHSSSSQNRPVSPWRSTPDHASPQLVLDCDYQYSITILFISNGNSNARHTPRRFVRPIDKRHVHRKPFTTPASPVSQPPLLFLCT